MGLIFISEQIAGKDGRDLMDVGVGLEALRQAKKMQITNPEHVDEVTAIGLEGQPAMLRSVRTIVQEKKALKMPTERIRMFILLGRAEFHQIDNDA